MVLNLFIVCHDKTLLCGCTGAESLKGGTATKKNDLSISTVSYNTLSITVRKKSANVFQFYFGETFRHILLPGLVVVVPYHVLQAI